MDTHWNETPGKRSTFNSQHTRQQDREVTGWRSGSPWLRVERYVLGASDERRRLYESRKSHFGMSGSPLEAGFSATRPRDTEIPRSNGPGALLNPEPLYETSP